MGSRSNVMGWVGSPAFHFGSRLCIIMIIIAQQNEWRGKGDLKYGTRHLRVNLHTIIICFFSFLTVLFAFIVISAYHESEIGVDPTSRPLQSFISFLFCSVPSHHVSQCEV